MSKNIITLCDKTIRHLKTILLDTNSKYILIGVRGGGCNGLKYYIEPTNEEPEKFDEILKIDNLQINVCGKSILHLLGTEIKWKEDYMGKGLDFTNPNAKNTCGCGETFSI